MGNRKIELENREKVWVGLQKLAFERTGIPFIPFIPVSQKMKKKEQPGRSFPSPPRDLESFYDRAATTNQHLQSTRRANSRKSSFIPSISNPCSKIASNPSLQLKK
jgi:hypothetical protein